MGKRYSMDMSQERERQVLKLEEGWHTFEIAKVSDEEMSKNGNSMIRVNIVLDKDASQEQYLP